MFKEDYLKIFGNKSLGDLSIVVAILSTVELSMYLCAYYFGKNEVVMFILNTILKELLKL